MKTLISFILALGFSISTFAQGTLQFNQAKIVKASDGVVTVPANKVWKVITVFGESSASSDCIQLRPYCLNSSYPNISANDWFIKGFKVDGKVVWRSVEIGFTNQFYYQSTGCVGSQVNYDSYPNCKSYVENNLSQSFDELAASTPFWVPAGSTLEAVGSETFVSLIEFNIIP